MGYSPRLRVIGDWLSLFSRGRRNKPARRSAGAIRSRRLRHEPLEDRRVLATLMVNNLLDTDLNDVDDSLSLREAILVVNQQSLSGLSSTEQVQITGAIGSNDTIVFDSELFEEEMEYISLTSLGELEITSNVTIIGPNRDLLTIQAYDPSGTVGDGSRVFKIMDETPKISVSISRLTISGGDISAEGGGVYSEGNLILDSVAILDNAAATGGGVHQFEGTLKIVNSVVDQNSATSGGGGINAVATESMQIIGSTIGSEVTRTIGDPDDPTDITYTPGIGNTAGTAGGGLRYLTSSRNSGPTNESLLLIQDSFFGSNKVDQSGSTFRGGGVFIDLDEYCELDIRDSEFIGNRSTRGGGLWISKLTNEEEPLEIGHMVLSDLNIEGNFSDTLSGFEGGAGIWLELDGLDAVNGSPMLIDRTTIANNTTQLWDGVHFTISDPHNSGGLTAYVRHSPLRIQNSSIYGNETDSASGGLFIFSFNVVQDTWEPIDNAYVEVVNTTISRNRAATAGGAWSEGPVIFRHSTITQNTAEPFGEYQYTTTGGGYLAHFLEGFTNELQAIIDHSIIAGNFHNPDEVTPEYAEASYGPDISFKFPPYPAHEEPYLTLEVHWSIVGGGFYGPPEDGIVGNGALELVGNNPEYFGISPDIEEELKDNGGTTLTHKPIPPDEIDPDGQRSNVIDAGNPDLEAGVPPTPSVDQRNAGYSRVVATYQPEKIIDIGAVEHQPDPIPPCPPGDYNENGLVEIADYIIYRNTAGRKGIEPFSAADGNGDGMVDIADYWVWAENFGSTCEEYMTDQLPILPGDYNEDGTVDDDDFNVWETNFGSTTNLDADGNENGIVDLEDLKIWQEYRGTTVMEEILGDFDENGVVDMNDLTLWEAQDPAADANGDMVVDQDDYDIWEENFGMMAAWIMPTLTGSTGGLPLDKPMQAPFITEVTVSGSASTHDPYNFSGVTGSGAQLVTVPVGGADTLQVKFSEEVLVTSTAFTLTRLQGGSPLVVDDFTYDLDTQTASWVFDDVLPSGQYLLQLSDSIFDLDHDALDGEFSNPWSINDSVGTTSDLPSGDGEAGGEFRFRFTLLAGDYSHNNVSNVADSTIWSNNNGMMSGATHANGDGDGDGDVDMDDRDIWFYSFGADFTNWQSSEPGMILVSTATDEDDANYAYGDVSLREALDLAASNAGHDTIVFRQDLWDSTLTLTMGQLIIDSDVTIAGPGADKLSISGNDSSRVFFVDSGVEATLQGLTITEGYAPSANGGGIYTNGDLELNEVVLYDNHAGNSGGGLYMAAGSVNIVNSTFDSNSAYHGGGARFYMPNSGPVSILGSTFSNNDATGTGGGIHVWGQGTTEDEIWIVNSTFSANTSGLSGGGIRAHYQDGVYLVNSTIYDNHSSGGDGGGISAVGTGTAVTARNTIIAQNTAPSGPNYLVHGGFVGGSGNNITSGDPDLAPLDYYGGRTKTHAILPGSDAIDGGDADLARDTNGVPLGTDGRGKAFARLAGDTVDIGAFEYGVALTVSTLADEDDGLHGFGNLSLREALALAVAIPGADTIVFDAKLVADPSSIVLGEELVVDSDLTIDGPGADLLTIDGDGNGRVFNVESGVDAMIRGVTITDGYEYQGAGVYSEGNLILDSVIITENEGNAYSSNGVGIYSTIGSLELRNSLVFDNNLNGMFAGYGVGGVYSYAATSLLVDGTEISGHENLYTGDEGLVADGTDTVIVTNSTIAENTTDWEDTTSGISIVDALVVGIINTTVSGNVANGYGRRAGIRISGASTDADLIHVTVAYNESNYSAGVFVWGGADVTLHNSIVAENGGGEQLWGGFSSASSYNLVGYNSSLGDGINNGVNGNQVGGESASPAIDARLAPLDNYGGPTRTHALYYDSPAIDAGDDAIATAFSLLYDQRGKDRFDDGDFDDDVVVDIGAFEVAFGKYYGAA